MVHVGNIRTSSWLQRLMVDILFIDFTTARFSFLEEVNVQRNDRCCMHY